MQHAPAAIESIAKSGKYQPRRFWRTGGLDTGRESLSKMPSAQAQLALAAYVSIAKPMADGKPDCKMVREKCLEAPCVFLCVMPTMQPRCGRAWCRTHRALTAGAAGPHPAFPRRRESKNRTGSTHPQCVVLEHANPSTKARVCIQAVPFPLLAKAASQPKRYTMLAGTTQASNSSPVTKPEASAASRRLSPCWCARLAICAALS